MGAWGPGIFSDDGANDLRSDYRELLESGLSDDEALAKITSDYADDFADIEEGPGLRIALALVLHRLGRLPDDILADALAAIDAGPDDRWDTPRLAASRQKALDKARFTLESPQKPRSRVRKPWADQTTLEPGMVLAFEHAGIVTLLRVVCLDSTLGGISPAVRTLRWERPGLPSQRRLKRVPDMPTHTVQWVPGRGRPDQILQAACIVHRMKRADLDYADAGFEIVGRVPARRGDTDMVVTGFGNWEQVGATIESGAWFTPFGQTWHASMETAFRDLDQ